MEFSLCCSPPLFLDDSKTVLRICYSFGSFFDALGIDSSIPRRTSLEEKKKKYQYTMWTANPPQKYPPHLKSIPGPDQVSQFELFNVLGLLEAETLLPKLVPAKTFFSRAENIVLEETKHVLFGEPYEGKTIAELENNFRRFRKSGTDEMRGQTIGDYQDWYSDARFAQQQFTGVQPVTITLASTDWINKFTAAAVAQGKDAMMQLLKHADPKSLYVQDCSYYRQAVGAALDAPLVDAPGDGTEARYASAAVTLYQLPMTGELHPLAIIIDYKGSMENSVTIFNKRLSHSESTHDEALDWPWRYAKTCAQMSDWVRHEVAIHLTHAHLIEEATIVATHRCIPEEHPVFELLQPHWYKTLSLNAAARSSLVPSVVLDLIGLTESQGHEFIMSEYKNFDFVGHYVPNDLSRRGFPVSALESKQFHKYGYARNINAMWNVLHQYVSAILKLAYTSDEQVANDTYIADWCATIQSEGDQGGQIPTFPTIKTIAQLVDACTMCIHIAAPQHTAVNYLQNFYQGFVIARPPALFTPLPTSLDELQHYTEQDLVAALPANRPRQWLLAAHVPWLLSFRVAEEKNLVNHAVSLYNLYKRKRSSKDQAMANIGAQLYTDLKKLQDEYERMNAKLDPPYIVLYPANTAVSILI